MSPGPHCSPPDFLQCKFQICTSRSASNPFPQSIVYLESRFDNSGKYGRVIKMRSHPIKYLSVFIKVNVQQKMICPLHSREFLSF
jgi:hypothetical protein